MHTEPFIGTYKGRDTRDMTKEEMGKALTEIGELYSQQLLNGGSMVDIVNRHVMEDVASTSTIIGIAIGVTISIIIYIFLIK